MSKNTPKNFIFTKFLLCAILLLLQYPLFADNFDFNPNVAKAYRAALSLRLDEAKTLTNTEHRANRNNLAADFIDNYVDFFRIFVGENKADFDRLAANKDYRLERIESLGDPASPYFLYTQAQIRLQWAIARIKFEEYVSAALDIKKAAALLEKNQKKFPDFMPNKASLGVLHAALGTIPDNYKWAADLAGMSGSVEQGRREVEEVVRYAKKNDFLFEDEVLVMYSFLLLHVGNQQEEAWKSIKSAKLNTTQNPLACFVQANVALNTGHTDDAIKILEKRPKSADFLPFHYLDYMLGFAKLCKGDADAKVFLASYVSNFKGITYIKDCYEKLAWESLLNGNTNEYRTYMLLCRKQGKAVAEADKKAQRDAETGIMPNIILLRARLYFDGGFYTKAKTYLEQFPSKTFVTPSDKLEYHYRLGRICDKSGDLLTAIQYFKTTVQDGRTLPYYYACNAALQLGLVFEKQKNYIESRSNYNLCLSLSPKEYKESLHQKAKAGLSRIKGK